MYDYTGYLGIVYTWPDNKEWHELFNKSDKVSETQFASWWVAIIVVFAAIIQDIDNILAVFLY